MSTARANISVGAILAAMRSRVLVVLGVLLVGGAVWWWMHSRTHAAAVTPPSPPSSHRDPARANGDRNAPTGSVVTDDDVRGELRLEGQVVDGHDEPVGGATVVLSSNPPRTATTEADGGFAFDELVGRPYTLIARAKQGVAGPVTAKLTAKSEPVVLHLRPAAKVRVEIADASGASIDGATVELRGIDHQTLKSDRGAAVFAPVVPGGYQVVAIAPGHARAMTILVVRTSDVTIKLVLAAGASVRGHVVDDHGAPVAGARVAFQGASDFIVRGDPRYDGVTTGTDGAFELAAMGAGSYRFTASHPAYAPGVSEIITLDGKTDRGDVAIKLATGATVRGRVIDAAKQPVGGARVRVANAAKRSIGLDAPRQTYSASDGTFELRGLARRELVAFAIGESAASSAKDVDTTRGDVTGVELVLDVTGTIAGTVVDTTGQPIEGAQVSAFPSLDSFGAGTDFTQLRLRGATEELTDAGGKFTLVGLVPGSYRVTAARERSASRGRRNPFGGGSSDGVVAQTGKRDLTITLEPEGNVKGKVMLADGTAPPAFTVSIGGMEQSFTAGPSFELDGLVPQQYSLTVTGPMFVPSGTDVIVPAGATADVGTITLSPGRTLAGVVVASGTPVPNATVTAGTTLIGNGAQASMSFGGAGGPFAGTTKSTTTGTDGTFAIAGLGSGDLTIVADEPTLGRSPALRVTPDSPNQSQLVLQLAPPGALFGTVTSGGKPVEGTIVSCQSTTTPGAISAVTTGPDGTYRYDRLAADTYKVSATIGMPLVGMKFYSQVTTVPSGGQVRADLAADGGSITLNVTAQPASGKLGLAIAWLANGAVTATNARELSLQIAAAGAGASQLAISLTGGPITYSDVIAGAYTICVVPFPSDVAPSGALNYIQLHGQTLPAFCQSELVTPAPATQSATVPVMIPANGSGSGSGS
jgi:protocatechuate 3,4-dioxygenase beta subunit